MNEEFLTISVTDWEAVLDLLRTNIGHMSIAERLWLTDLSRRIASTRGIRPTFAEQSESKG